MEVEKLTKNELWTDFLGHTHSDSSCINTCFQGQHTALAHGTNASAPLMLLFLCSFVFPYSPPPFLSPLPPFPLFTRQPSGHSQASICQRSCRWSSWTSSMPPALILVTKLEWYYINNVVCFSMICHGISIAIPTYTQYYNTGIYYV